MAQACRRRPACVVINRPEAYYTCCRRPACSPLRQPGELAEVRLALLHISLVAFLAFFGEVVK